jgi:hypothetical protein
MPHRDDHPDMWRRPPEPRRAEDPRRLEDRGEQGGERRSFAERPPNEQGRFNSDQARYTGSDYTNYAPLGRNDRGRRPDYQGYQGGYGGQEYGVGAGGREYGHDSDYGGVWGRSSAERGPAHELRQPGRDQPFGQSVGAAEGYAHPHERDLDPDYLSWRDHQMHQHDQDYACWRAEQHRRYDEDYRRFRGERRSHFHQSFEDWRRQQQQNAGQASEFSRPPPALQQATDGEAPSPARGGGEAHRKEDKDKG